MGPCIALLAVCLPCAGYTVVILLHLFPLLRWQRGRAHRELNPSPNAFVFPAAQRIHFAAVRRAYHAMGCRAEDKEGRGDRASHASWAFALPPPPAEVLIFFCFFLFSGGCLNWMHGR